MINKEKERKETEQRDIGAMGGGKGREDGNQVVKITHGVKSPDHKPGNTSVQSPGSTR